MDADFNGKEMAEVSCEGKEENLNAQSQQKSQQQIKRGNFVVYTSDGSRFSILLEYLGSPIFQELLKMSKDEYGLPRNGLVILPCNADFMNYVVSLIQSMMPEDVEKALLLSMANAHCCNDPPASR
ncbi:hypothetical protein ACLOJK_018245 [Asimina triloba]